MRLIAVLSLVALATGISSLAVPGLHGVGGVEIRHEHGGFKKSKRSASIDFPDGGDSDGGVDNLPPTKIYERIPTVDFPDDGDSDGGPDNVPPPKKVIERIPFIDFPDGGDSDGGVDNIRPTKEFKRMPLEKEDEDDFYDDEDSDGADEDYGDVEVKKIKRHEAIDFPDGGDSDGGVDDVVVVKKLKRNPFVNLDV